MQKNFSSFWDLIQSRPIPPRAIITAAPEHLYELVRTCLKGTQSTMNHASTQRIRELLTNLQEVDLFSEPSMMIIEGAPTVQQVELLRTYDSRLQPDDTLWLLTTSRKVALNWPIIAYYPPTLNDLQHLLKCTPLEAKTLFETTELNYPLCIIQLVQQAKVE